MSFKKLLNLIQIAVVALGLVILFSTPGSSQFSIDNSSSVFDSLRLFESNSMAITKSPVVLDGRELFSVSESRDVSAKDRVKQIQSELQLAINLPESPQVTIKQSNQLPVLYLNNRYLYTVTNQDKVGREALQERAEKVKNIIEQGIAQAQKERTASYLRRQSLIASLILLISVITSRFLKQLEKHQLPQAIQKVIPSRLNPQSNIEAAVDQKREITAFLTMFLRFQLGLVKLILWVVVFLLITGLFPYSRNLRYYFFSQLRTIFTNSITTKIVSIGSNSYSILDLLFILILFAILLVAIRFTTNLLRTQILQATGINRGSQEVILVITKYSLIFFGAIIVLQASGFDLSSLTIIGSVLGVGIGIGLQDIAKNFASGLVLLFERSVQVGDFIEVGEHIGTVERVGARSIVLKTLDSISVIVPNSRLLAEEVINWTHDNPSARLHIPVGVAYDSDVAKVKAALLQAAQEQPEVLRYPQPQVFFTNFGDSALDFELLVWTSDPSRQTILTSDLYFRIEAILREEEIQIPFPQRDLHLRTGNLSSLFSPELESNLLQLLKSLTARQSRNGKR